MWTSPRSAPTSKATTRHTASVQFRRYGVAIRSTRESPTVTCSAVRRVKLSTLSDISSETAVYSFKHAWNFSMPPRESARKRCMIVAGVRCLVKNASRLHSRLRRLRARPSACLRSNHRMSKRSHSSRHTKRAWYASRSEERILLA